VIDQSILARHPKNVHDVVRFLDSSHLADARLRFTVQRFETLAAELMLDMNTSADLVLTLRALVAAKNLAMQAKILDIENNGDNVQTQSGQ